MKNRIIIACLLLLTSCLLAQSQGPVSCYSFDQGAFWDDVLQRAPLVNGLPGLCSDRFGQPNKAISFDCNKAMAIGDDTLVKPRVGTVSVWVNVLDFCSNGQSYPYYHNPIIQAYGASGYRNFELSFVRSNMRFSAKSAYSINVSTIFSPDNSVVYGQWNHLLMTFKTDSFSLYMNGVLIGTGDRFLWPYDASEQVAVGFATQTRNSFNGQVDDVRIYDRVLSASEVQQLYQASAASSISCSAVLGTEELASKDGLPTLMPNPTNGYLVALHPSGLGFGQVSVFDMMGRMVYSAYNLPSRAELSLTELPAGTYIVSLEDEEGKVSRHKVLITE